LPDLEGAIGRRTFVRMASAAAAAAAAAPGDLRAQPPPGVRPRLIVFHDPATLGHEPSPGHPEQPSRIGAALAGVGAVDTSLRAGGTPEPATDEDLLRVHTARYLALVKAEVAARRPTLSTGDTELSARSLDAARAAAGCVVSAVDAVMKGPIRHAFCAIRPPGHHASPGRGMGFCLFNNIAIGVRYAQARFGVGRVLIVDWDVHHGNGTQDVFWSDGSVLFFDTHQHPWYPGTGLRSETGEGKARGLMVNRPLPAGSGRREVLAAFRDDLLPAAERHRPEIVMISAGFDSRRGDPLGQFTLEDGDFADLTRIVCEVAREFAGGRVVSVLEGGYRLEGLKSAVGAHVKALGVSDA
jgi:acetoin utilization deacetylase AcuC-like enzyme